MLYATHAVVHLDRLRANVEGVRARVAPRQVLAAVKADAYGHGAVRVGRMLEKHGLTEMLGVATVPEALELRTAGVGLPILKLSHVISDDEAHAAIGADVITACVSAENARLLAEAGAAMRTPARVHLKVDTGMRRIGAEADDAAELAALATDLGLSVEGIFTHMPVSDDPAEDDFSHDQVVRFRAVVDAVHARLGRELQHVHMANSGAVLGHEEAWLTMVRPGIMLYGYYPDAATPRTVDVQPVLEWKSRVSFVKRVEAGETVGYGRTWRAGESTCVATVPVGYADGYPRVLSNRGRVLVGGVERRVVGRVCMDQLMVEVDEGTQVGDEVVLIGRQGDAQVSADDIAALAGTISYEVTCDIARRVERVYE